jgi:hypothetical protein
MARTSRSKRELSKQSFGVLEHPRSNGARNHALANTIEESSAELALELDQLMAHCRLRQVQMPRGAGHALLGGDRSNKPEVPRIEQRRRRKRCMRMFHLLHENYELVRSSSSSQPGA